MVFVQVQRASDNETEIFEPKAEEECLRYRILELEVEATAIVV